MELIEVISKSGKRIKVRANITNDRLKSMDCARIPALLIPTEPIATQPPIEDKSPFDDIVLKMPPGNGTTLSKDLHWSKAVKRLKGLDDGFKDIFLEGETRNAVLKHK